MMLLQLEFKTKAIVDRAQFSPCVTAPCQRLSSLT